MQKFDPYINVDPGTLSPYQHGEVFVTDDGAKQTSIWSLRRFIDENLSINSNVTTGKIYWSVITKERHGDYEGKNRSGYSAYLNEIKDRVYRVARTQGNRHRYYPKSAVLSAILSPHRFWKQSDRLRQRSAEKTAFMYISRLCRT